jgi:hypothetical protein
MRRLGFTLFACLLAATGLAADPHWTQVAGKADYSMVVYLDTNSVKVREGRLTAWVQTNYVVALKTTDRVPKEYLSTIAFEAFDCESERSAPISITLFSGSHAEGEVVGRESIDARTMMLEYNRPGSIAEATLEAVCRAAPSEAHTKSGPNPAQLTAPRPAAQPQYTSNNYYKNSDGNEVHGPAYTTTGGPPPGATAQCADGTYSSSQHHQGTCSHHGGVASWMN